jgi:hypothetical protein
MAYWVVLKESGQRSSRNWNDGAYLLAFKGSKIMGVIEHVFGLQTSDPV